MSRNQKKPHTLPRGRTWVPATLTLALWQLRRTGGLLLIIGIGILVAVVLICIPPLYAQVVTTAGLRDTINSSVYNSMISVSGHATKVTASDTQTFASAIDNHAQDTIGRYITSAQFSIHTAETTLFQPGKNGRPPQPLLHSYFQLTTYVTNTIGNHLHLLRGRLPHTVKDGLEIALTTDNAQYLHAVIGSLFIIKIAVNNEPVARYEYVVPLHVVGIFSSPAIDDAYWHGDTFPYTPPTDVNPNAVYSGLASSTDLVNMLSSYWPVGGTFDPKHFDTRTFTVLEAPVYLSWYYSLDPNKIKDSELDTTIAQLNTFQTSIANDASLDKMQFFEQVKVIIPTVSLQQYMDETAVAQIPTLGISLIILSLLLYFIALMADLLVARQSTALAVLRSRGASQGQVFGSLLLQSIGLGVIGLLAGPFLALLVVRLISHWLLPAKDLGALNAITNDILYSVGSVVWYAVGVIGVILLAIVLAINHTTSLDVLAMRREGSRTTQRPLWLRFNLDILAVILMIAGFIASNYLANSDVLDAHLRLILLSPLVLVRTIFTIIAAILIFLRIFPYLLRLGSSLALRSRGASSMIALAQMARAPRQALRLTLLLSLATAFSIFATIFYTSQVQRAYDVASFTVGSDFLGTLSGENGTLVKRTTTLYKQSHGVLSASVGETIPNVGAGANINITSTILAVDADTFGQTIYWPNNNSAQPLSTLMQQLVEQRSAAIRSRVIPAFVDSALWESLNLHTGGTFSIADPTISSLSLHYLALGEIQHVPTVLIPNGVLVDFSTFYNVRLVATRDYGSTEAATLNLVWLRTASDASSLASTRHLLSTGMSYQDRRALLENLHNEPLYIDLIGILTLGPGTVLLLALVGNLLASWLNARDRQLSFALLRALGATSHNIAATLTWEQGILYTTAIILGVTFGALLSLMVIPSLLFTSVSSTNLSDAQFYLAQNIPAIQIIIPVFAGIGLAVLVGLCVVALSIMVRTVARPQISQALRISND